MTLGFSLLFIMCKSSSASPLWGRCRASEADEVFNNTQKKVVTTIQVTTSILHFYSTVIRAVAYTLNSPTAVCRPWANLARASLAEAISSAAADCCSAAADTLSISEAT